MVLDCQGDPWWVVSDVLPCLGLTHTSMAIARIPERERGRSIVDTPGGPQEMLTVNEPGLYRLTFGSRKPQAERFKDWVFGKVLPTIRRTGAYIHTKSPANRAEPAPAAPPVYHPEAMAQLIAATTGAMALEGATAADRIALRQFARVALDLAEIGALDEFGARRKVGA